MPLVELRREQDQISLEAARLFLPTLLAGVNADLAVPGWTRLIAALYPALVAFRARSATVAWLAARAELATVVRPPAPVYDPAWAWRAVQRSIVDRTFASELEVTPSRLASDGTASLVRHVEQAGRETTIRIADSEDRIAGWARVSDGTPCAFCALMLSRGVVYRSGSARSGGFQAHDHDRCVAVVVRNEMNWPGREDHLRYQQLYVDATRGEKNKDKANAFRRAVERPE